MIIETALVEPIRAIFNEAPSFGYRTVAILPGINKTMVQRIFQLKGWQLRKRPFALRLRIEAFASVATRPDERRATELRGVRAGRMFG